MPIPALKSPTKPKKEITLTFLVVGGCGVGKTSIIRRYVYDVFMPFGKVNDNSGNRKAKTIDWDSETVVHVQFQDTGCSDNLINSSSSYFADAAAVICVFDFGKLWSFESAQTFVAEIKRKIRSSDGSMVPIVLLANKGDLNCSFVTKNDIIEFCKTNGIAAWSIISAAENVNIDIAMEFLIRETMSRQVKNKPEKFSTMFRRVEKKIKYIYQRKMNH